MRGCPFTVALGWHRRNPRSDATESKAVAWIRLAIRGASINQLRDPTYIVPAPLSLASSCLPRWLDYTVPRRPVNGAETADPTQRFGPDASDHGEAGSVALTAMLAYLGEEP